MFYLAMIWLSLIAIGALPVLALFFFAPERGNPADMRPRKRKSFNLNREPFYSEYKRGSR